MKKLILCCLLALAACSGKPAIEYLPNHLRNDEGLYLQMLSAMTYENEYPTLRMRIVNDAPISQRAYVQCMFFRDEETIGEDSFSLSLRRYEQKVAYAYPPYRSMFRMMAACQVASHPL